MAESKALIKRRAQHIACTNCENDFNDTEMYASLFRQTYQEIPICSTCRSLIRREETAKRMGFTNA